MTTGEARALLTDLLAWAAVRDTAAETETRQLLIDLGAQTYLLAVARVQYREAVAAL